MKARLCFAAAESNPIDNLWQDVKTNVRRFLLNFEKFCKEIRAKGLVLDFNREIFKRLFAFLTF